jgi:DNA-binding GntR family transcriptional regulator
MTFKAPDSLAEQIAHHLAERIIRGDLKPGERIQEQKVTLALNVSRGSVREALLILERRHLIAILPRRGAHVTELTAHKVQSLCTLMSELYILLGNAVAQGWQVQADMAPFLQIQQRLVTSYERQDIRAFVEESFNVMRAAYPFARYKCPGSLQSWHHCSTCRYRTRFRNRIFSSQHRCSKLKHQHKNRFPRQSLDLL